MAQLVLGVAGAAIGGLAGPLGAQLGWAIGSAIGSSLQTNRVEGARLEDLRVIGSEYGAVLPYIEGAPRLAGQVIWASDRREIATTQSEGGKGGPRVETTTYTYEVDLLIKFTSVPATAVTRIWANGELIYSTLAGTTLETAAATEDSIWARDIRILLGGPDQLPDPTYEAAVGVGEAPAYRGSCCIMFEGLQLGGSGVIPNITAEVVTSATPGQSDEIVWELDARDDSINDAGLFSCLVANPTGFRLIGGRIATSTAAAFRSAGATVVELDADFTIAENLTGGGAGVIYGTTDVQGFATRRSVPTPEYIRWYEAPTGTVYQWAPTNPFRGVPPGRFAKRGNRIFFGANGSYRQLWACTLGQPTEDAFLDITSDVTGFTGMFFDGTFLYLLLGNRTIRVYDANLTYVDTLPEPVSGSGQDTLCGSDDGRLYYYRYDVGSLWRWDDPAWTLVYQNIPKWDPAEVQLGCPPYVHGGALYRISRTLVGAEFARAQQMYVTREAFTRDGIPLSDVVARLCERSGLESADYDVSELTSDTVRAMVISQVSSARATLDMLRTAYFFESSASDRIYWRKRGGAAVATIPFDDLITTGDEPAIRRTDPVDTEIPNRFSVTYNNIDGDYLTATEHGFRMTTLSEVVQALQLPLGLEPEHAKGIANTAAADVLIGSTQIEITVGPRYVALEPCDVIEVVDRDGYVLTVRIVRITDDGLLRRMECVLDDAAALQPTADTDTDYSETIQIPLVSPTDLVAMDIPILRDVDDAPGHYVHVRPLIDDARWPGAAVVADTDGTGNYERIADVTDAGIGGRTVGALGNWSGGATVDYTNTLRVAVVGELESITRDALLSTDRNVALVGSELIQFQVATLVAPGTYDLSGLLRGRRGTEWAIGGHTASERFVLLQAAGIRRVPILVTQLGLSRTYRAVTFGRALPSAEDVSFTDSGIGLKPFAPNDGRIARDGSDDITITWARRTRLAVRYGGPGGTYAPLGEESEAYEIDVYDGSGFANVVRTITASSETAAYTAAQQTTDHGSPQSTIYIRIYQLSALVGRGYPLEVTG